MKKTMLLLSVFCIAMARGEVPPVRMAYNYCTLSYTFAFYSDAMWKAEVERLAAAGYNAALVTDGTFKVWQLTLRELGFRDDEIFAFIPDECARAWWLMDNLYGEGGPLDQATIDADGERGRMICTAMRAKGIEPVLQGYFGMTPPGTPGAIAQGPWSCYERPPILNPLDARFATFATAWYRNLEKVYAIRPKYLAGDLFHEGGNTAGIDVTAATKAVQDAQQRAFPGVVWMVQAWQANPTPQVRAGLDPRFTLIEALVKDVSAFAAADAKCELDFGDLPWIWCEVLNFGGNHGLYGNLKTFARLGRAAKGKGAKTFRGYGSLSEGFFTNKICSDLFEEMMMREAGSEMSDAELSAWIASWVEKRNGSSDPHLLEAWRILADTVYACPRLQEGTTENVMCASPSWNANNVSTWGPRDGLWYDPERLERALKLLDECADAANPFDVADVRRQCMANNARSIVPFLQHSQKARREFLELIDEAAFALSEIPEFRLSTYEAQARERAGERGVKAFRRMVTSWAAPKYGVTTLTDYANREYSELLRDYYLPRWEKFLTTPEKH